MSNQERRLMRRMGGGHQTSPGGLYIPQGARSPQDEQDDRRTRLAEQVLLEMTTDVCWTDSGDEVADREKAAEAMRTAAHAALAAAEVIYPELPAAGGEITEAEGAEVLARAFAKPPAAAQKGAQAVLGPVDALLNDQKTVVEGCWPMTAEEYARRLAAGEIGGRTVVIDHSGIAGTFHPARWRSGLAQSVPDAAGEEGARTVLDAPEVIERAARQAVDAPRGEG